MLLHHKKFICKDSKGGRRTKPTLKNPKDYGINTDPTAQGFHLFRFLLVFLSPLQEEAYKLFHYAKSSTYFSRQPVRQLPFLSAGYPSALAAFTFCLSALYPQVIISPSASFWHQGLSASLWLLSFGAIHQVFVSFQHCPFRALLLSFRP
jgi:hypothetical protein